MTQNGQPGEGSGRLADGDGNDLAGGVTPPGDTVEVLPVPAGAVVVPERLAALEAKVAAAVTRARSAATLRAYRSDWADFSLWCAGLGLQPLPAAPATVAAYVVSTPK